MKKYIQCILRADPLIIMNVEKAKNIEYLNKNLWTIEEKHVKELPHLHVFGNAQVFGNTQVSGDAKVYGNALVYGYSELRGEAIATTKVYNIGFLEWNVTLSNNHIQIGCKQWEYEKFLRLSEIHIGLEYSQEEYSEMENAKNIIIETIRLKRPDLFEKEDN